MASYPYILFFFFLSLLSLLTFSSSIPNTNTNTINLPLSPLFTKSQSSDLINSLKTAASSSLTRAHHLKTQNPNHKKPSSSSPTNTKIYPKSYGGYSINLNFGTPPQTLSFILDTGSSLVWFPCSSHYLCSNCNFPNINPTKIPSFIPRNSSTSKILGCTNSKCGYIFGPDIKSRCRGCNPQSQNCGNITCPAYIIQYGLGSTAGFLLLDNLDFPGKKTVDNFLVGCSILSTRQPSGIAGFGRGEDSLPSQMGLKRFSYCLLSHQFDDSPENSNLVLQVSSTGDTKTSGLSYTPFRKNPSTNNTAFLEYYYVNLRTVVIGGKRVKIPLTVSEPGTDGNGGTIVDSGSTFTYMEKEIFDLVSKEFEKQLSNYSRAKDVEAASGLGLCFNFTDVKTVLFPELVFQFKGGAKMKLPVENYFSLAGEGEAACLTVMSDGVSAPERNGGPAIILGNYQQQNFNVEFDLENDRFGFGPQSCQKSA